jgi:hypothetical protein
MSVNSTFNCILCLVFAFYPIYYCNQFKSDFFCSFIFNSLFYLYFKIVFIAYLGETIKMCSNISYILITINRYMLIGKDHSPLLKRISKLKIKHVVSIAILVSLSLNIGHMFQFKIYGYNTVSDPLYKLFSSFYYYSYPSVRDDSIPLGAYSFIYFSIKHNS